MGEEGGMEKDGERVWGEKRKIEVFLLRQIGVGRGGEEGG